MVQNEKASFEYNSDIIHIDIFCKRKYIKYFKTMILMHIMYIVHFERFNFW